MIMKNEFLEFYMERTISVLSKNLSKFGCGETRKILWVLVRIISDKGTITHNYK